MKTKILLLTILCTIFYGNAQYTFVPDDNFEQALIDLGYDSGALDNYVLTANINTITNLYVNNKNISDLTGIEDFTALEVLGCHNNFLNSLDVSSNTNLQKLYCYGNSLTTLDVSANTMLELLDCGINEITSLDVSANTMLNFLMCDSNYLISLNVKNGNNVNFTYFDARYNPSLTCIEVDDAAYSTTNWTNIDLIASFSENCSVTYVPDDNFEQALIVLGLDSGALDDYVPTANINTITALNISNENISDLTGIQAFSALEYLNCADNNLSNLNVTANVKLVYLYCNNNNLTSLDVSNNVDLEFLSCYQNNLSNLDVTLNTSLITLECNNNNLSSLDVTSNFSLSELYCYNNNLTDLDVTGNTSLVNLDCGGNNLSSLDVSANLSLFYLGCYSNNLSSLDISGNIFLKTLDVFYNNLTGLDTTSTSLESLNCSYNNLTSLDVSSNTSLTFLICSYNYLTELNVKNGNNTNLINFSAVNNPDLTCIIVDDAAWSTANWTNIDPTSTFVNSQAECDALSINDQNLQNNIKVYPNPATDKIYIDTTNNLAINKVEMYDLLGKIVYNSNKPVTIIPVNNFKTGIYFVKLTSNNISKTKKILIAK